MVRDKNFIVAFDFDGTLIRGDSTILFLLNLRGIFGIFFDLLHLTPKLIKIIIFNFNKKEIKELIIQKAIKSTTIEKRRFILSEKLPYILKRRLRPEAIKRLHWHKEQGHKCFIISASPEPFIFPIAKELDIEIISTSCNEILKESSAYDFKLTSPNCNGPEKLIRLEKHLGYLPLPEELEAYGDSRGDRELLKASKFPHFRSFKKSPRKYIEINNIGLLITILASFILFLGINKIWGLDQAQLSGLVFSLKKLIYWIPVIYLILALSYFGRYMRWRILLGATSVGKTSIKDAIWWFRGFSLTATPAKLGEITRVHQLNKYLGYPKKNLLSIFFLERIFDLISVIIWIVLLSPEIFFFTRSIDLNYQIIFIFFLIILLIIYVFIKKFKKKIYLKINSLFPNFSSFEIIKIGFLGILVSIIFWGIESMILWLLVFILSPQTISIGNAIYIYLISGIAGIISGLPGGIGINEAASTIMLQNAGLSGLLALIISILRRLLTVWSITFLSIIFSLPIKRGFLIGGDKKFDN